MALKLYLQDAAAPYTPVTIRGAWDNTAGAGTRALGLSPLGSSGAREVDAITTSHDFDVLVFRFSYVLGCDYHFVGGVSGAIGARASAKYDLHGYLHLHIVVTQGRSDTLRGTLLNNLIDTEKLEDDILQCGEGFSADLTELQAYEGDVLVVEAGYRCNPDTYFPSGFIYYGGTETPDLWDGGGPPTHPGWISFEGVATTGADRQILWHIAPPIATLVSPTDEGWLQGLTPTFVFGTYNPDSDALHARLQLSLFTDFRSYVLDADSADDLSGWSEAADPYTDWVDLTASGATAGNRIRYISTVVLRYDHYHGRVQLVDVEDAVVSAWVYFDMTIGADASAPLQVMIGGLEYQVGACTIVETTGGEAGTIDVGITLSAFLADPLTHGDAIAVSSGLGGHDRTWNGTVESWQFQGSLVMVHALQDDAYLSRKLATGDETAADLGANLADFVDDYGAPLTPDGIDTDTGLSMALTGGYKYLREHFADGLKALPDYVYWVDETGAVYLVDQTGLPEALYELYEEDPSLM